MQNEQFISFHNIKVDLSFLPLLIKQTVHLDHGTWDEKNMDSLCLNIKQWKVESLYLYHNNKPQILKNLPQLALPNLQILEASNNDIQSIQGFSRGYMPVLQGLYIIYNKIHDASDFRKANWPNLRELEINGSMIKRSQKIAEMNSDKMKRLDLEYQSTDNDLGEIRWICKLKSVIETINSADRIKNVKFNKVIKKKYSQIVLDGEDGE